MARSWGLWANLKGYELANRCETDVQRLTWVAEAGGEETRDAGAERFSGGRPCRPPTVSNLSGRYANLFSQGGVTARSLRAQIVTGNPRGGNSVTSITRPEKPRRHPSEHD